MSFIFIISALHINSHYTTHHQLQIKNPDHCPSIPYEVKDVFDAAKFTLQGTGQTRPSAQELYLTLAPITPTAPTISPMAQSIFATTPSASNLPSMNTVINAQDLRALLSGFTRTIVEAVNSTSTTQRTRTGRFNPNLQDPVQILLPSVIQTSRTHHSNITATPAPFSAYMASKDHQLSDDDRITILEAEIYNFQSITGSFPCFSYPYRSPDTKKQSKESTGTRSANYSTSSHSVSTEQHLYHSDFEPTATTSPRELIVFSF